MNDPANVARPLGEDADVQVAVDFHEDQVAALAVNGGVDDFRAPNR